MKHYKAVAKRTRGNTLVNKGTKEHYFAFVFINLFRIYTKLTVFYILQYIVPNFCLYVYIYT